MKKKTAFKFLITSGILTLFLTGCFDSNDSGSMGGMDHTNMGQTDSEEQNNSTESVSTLSGNEFTLIARTSQLDITADQSLPVWTFNNSVPGPEIRVKQGENVKITLKNELPDPTAIHWHGLPIPNEMDGIPGVTQNAVQPGESFVYEFNANVSGTYWYHSHQDGVNQVDKGLYGSFIVEAEDNQVDRDYTLVLDEWMSSGSEGMDMSSMDHSNMNMGSSENEGSNMAEMEMDHGNMEDMEDTSDGMMLDHDMSMYDLFTINGKSGSSTEKLIVKEGEKVRLRLINAGFMSHNIHLHGHEFKVTATDGQPINEPGTLKDRLISIAPGERYDIEFEANNPGQWYLEEHGKEARIKGMKAVVEYEGTKSGKDQPNETAMLPLFELSNYGKKTKSKFTLDQKYDMEYTMDLGTEQQDGKQIFTINNQIYPNTENLKVKKGDKVKVRFVNNSKSDDHPMHLHGHFFQVLSKNGQPLKGSPMMKDTLNVKPGEEYIVAFEADNPGDWMFHCHDLHHASAGMVAHLLYTDYNSDFVPDPDAGNKPE
jgi:FtsP/CotA-like multicopper oxidase with cupredoxin domain